MEGDGDGVADGSRKNWNEIETEKKTAGIAWKIAKIDALGFLVVVGKQQENKKFDRLGTGEDGACCVVFTSGSPIIGILSL